MTEDAVPAPALCHRPHQAMFDAPHADTGLLSLNDDILTIILSRISPGNARQLLMTCRAAYDLALPRVLSEINMDRAVNRLHPGAKTDPDRIAEVCSFLLSDAPRRPRFIRKLTVNGAAMEDKAASAEPFRHAELALQLAQVLEHASGLRELTLSLMDRVFECEPRLSAAVAALPSLESISLRLTRIRHIPWSTLVCRPRRLRVMTAMGFESPDEDEQADLRSAIMQPSFQSLVSLDLSCASELLDAFDSSVSCPNIRHLAFSDDVVRTEHLPQCFPNVSTLCVIASCMGSLPPVQWPSLDIFTYIVEHGGPPVPLAGPIRRFKFVGEYSPNLLCFLERACPVVLEIGGEEDYRDPYVDDEDYEDFPSLIRSIPESVKFLKILQRQPDTNVDWIMRHAGLLSKLPLLGLHLGVRLDEESARLVQEPELLRTASTVACLVPTLTYIAISKLVMDSEKPRTLKKVLRYQFLVVSRDEHGSMLKTLSQDAAAAIEERLKALTKT
ncbi:hypothetical protein WOLCODRAFT_136519 [Wolfiporia cocos MD-104 SS10]|uniref:F-box domain-containing protein n=1 Tax=Wolfiporia cocos (strain MD-104) TaxID=742152 RepID=A0A2H3JIY1_WOLCO|nr:hypothetical protein WOLCODRAFT_136519 [Wolfiporia cocos MD-104 SS10]